MPKNTATPIACRISEPEPVEIASGKDAEVESEGGYPDGPQVQAAGLVVQAIHKFLNPNDP
jgi:hypothetical protein